MFELLEITMFIIINHLELLFLLLLFLVLCYKFVPCLTNWDLPKSHCYREIGSKWICHGEIQEVKLRCSMCGKEKTEYKN
ncbi:hypothetical protein BCT26_07495 [Vibrio lentus]|nr:hypothetical protein BCT26_07495 [Vibrio lentus]